MMNSPDRKVVFSGIQPSGRLTIANYIGAISQWLPMVDEDDCIFCMVDLHALTVPQDPADLKERFLEFLTLFVACGLDPEKCTLFVQSHVAAHSQLTWILNCVAGMGELNRMTQFKDKSAKQEKIGAGLYTYPLLMAADILLYGTHKVPVGEDQKQHVELCRDLAQRFNQSYGQTFVVPDVQIPKTGARVMSLQDPTAKMSKSDPNEKTWVALLDPPSKIRKKIKKAVTDSGEEVIYAEDRPALKNLIEIYASMSKTPVEQVVEKVSGMRYGDFKKELAEVVVDVLEPIQARYAELREDPAHIQKIMNEGAEKARALADPMVQRVYEAIGLLT